MQKQQAATEAAQEATEWAALVQQLSTSPIECLADGQSAVALTIEHTHKLKEEQRLALDNVASKDEALNTAECRLGQPSPPLLLT